MTDPEIRAYSRRLSVICEATCEELEVWMEEAFDLINDFCQQNFTYEKQVMKTLCITHPNTMIYLPKVLSGDILIADNEWNVLWSTDGSGSNQDGFEVCPGNFWFIDCRNNTLYPTPDAQTVMIKGDWGYANSPETLLVDYINSVVQTYDSHRLHPTAHLMDDVINVTALPAATDLDSAILRINELKGVINSHFGDFTVHTNADNDLITTPDAVDAPTAALLGRAIKGQFNLHIARDATSSPPIHLEADTANRMVETTNLDTSVLPRNIRRVFLRLVQRLALRDDPEDHRQMNMPYANETLGDQYTYDLSNGTLRNLIRPDEANMLRPYVNRGRIVV